MGLIRPSLVEANVSQFFTLDMTRPMYYQLVFQLATAIFYQLGFSEKAEELQLMINERLEEPLKRPIHSILSAYYNYKFIFYNRAYCKVGEGVDTIHVTRYEIGVVLEDIKRWCYQEVTQISQYVRFTQQTLPMG